MVEISDSKSPLSAASRLGHRNKNAISFTTNILIVGGAYSGLAALKSLQFHFSERMKHEDYREILQEKKISITLVEPRAGFLNILGIPKAIVDPQFAESQYVPFDELKGLSFDSVVSHNEEILGSLSSSSVSSNEDAGIRINYVHGKVTYLDTKKAQYILNEGEEKALIDFDYVIFASGRDRNWPTTPNAYTKSHFIEEMTKAKNEQSASNIITLIGGGAVGVELAGDIKLRFPEKTVNLVHSRSKCPTEPLSKEFKNTVEQSLRDAGVSIYFNTRVAKELDNGNLLTTSGSVIESSLNYWCNKHVNNTAPLSSDLQRLFVTPENNVSVNEYLQLHNRDRTVSNFFAIGDLVDLPIIKSAGWAMFMGHQVASNISSYILDDRLIETIPDLSVTPRGMVLIAGNGELVSELAGIVETNNPNYTLEYRDYCIGKIRATMGL